MIPGMRQIKFSALEIPWYNKIGFVRNKELSEQWSVFKFDAVLVLCVSICSNYY